MGIRHDAMIYSDNDKFLRSLRAVYKNGHITRQELLTLRGQALSGDPDGAQKGLEKLMIEREVKVDA